MREFHLRILALPVLLLVASMSQTASAQTACKSPGPDCVVVGEWNIDLGLGLGERSNPVRGNADIPLVLVPQISYYGERFFLENLELGCTLHERDADSFSLIATPGYDRVFFHRNDLQNVLVSLPFGTGSTGPVAPQEVQVPVRSRHTTYLIGPEWTFERGPLIGQLNALYEVTGRHKGYEVRGALAAPIIQSHGSLVASGGFTWKSDELVDYYYGITGVYAAGAALNPFLKLGYSLPLAERWTLGAFVHYEWLDDAVADSPIVTQDAVVTVFAGVVFKIL